MERCTTACHHAAQQECRQAAAWSGSHIDKASIAMVVEGSGSIKDPDLVSTMYSVSFHLTVSQWLKCKVNRLISITCDVQESWAYWIGMIGLENTSRHAT